MPHVMSLNIPTLLTAYTDYTVFTYLKGMKLINCCYNFQI